MEIARSCIREISHTIPYEKIQFKEEIGKGEYGQVFKAIYSNENVAAKKYSDSTKASAQILHEVATMK
jgi:predicted Ser/Thr protein kinase